MPLKSTRKAFAVLARSFLSCSRSVCFVLRVFTDVTPRLGGDHLELDPGTHRGPEDGALDVLALGGRRLRLHDGVDQRLGVLDEQVGLERDLADADVDDAGLVDAILDLT